jgi:glycosyltransferase domain-containing protein
MKYWSNQNVNIFIIDGSEKPLDKKKIRKVGKNIKYFYKPIGLFKRLLFAAKLVKTDFVMLGTDDEFFLTSALNSCLIELYRNKDLVTCGGVAIRYGLDKNFIYGLDCYSGLRGLYLNDETSKLRIEKHFSNYVPAHIYSITRTKIWKIIAADIFSHEYNFYSSAELQLEFLMCYAGKNKIIPELMFLRSNENQPIRGTSPVMNVLNTKKKWWYDFNYASERNKFFKRIKFVCLMLDRTLKKKDEVCFSILIEQFTKPTKGLLLDFIYKIYLKLPNFIKKKKNYIFNYFNSKFKKKISLVNQARLYEKEGIKIDYQQLKLVENTIKDSYKNN